MTVAKLIEILQKLPHQDWEVRMTDVELGHPNGWDIDEDDIKIDEKRKAIFL